MQLHKCTKQGAHNILGTTKLLRIGQNTQRAYCSSYHINLKINLTLQQNLSFTENKATVWGCKVCVRSVILWLFFGSVFSYLGVSATLIPCLFYYHSTNPQTLILVLHC